MAKYSSHILFLLISILVVILFANGLGPMEGLQQSLNDVLCRLTAPEGNPSNVVVVTIDGPALDQYGQWPWPRDLLADLSAATASGEPKVLVLDLDLQEDPFQDSAGYTEILKGQLSWIPNVILAYDIALANYKTSRTTKPDVLFNNSIAVETPLGIMDEDASLLARKVFLPADKLLEARPYLGFEYESPDDDRILRRQAQVMHYEGFYYPSASLLAAARYFDIGPEHVRVIEGEGVDLHGQAFVPLSSQSKLYLSFNEGNQFLRYSASQVLSESFDRRRLAGKVVIIALDDIGRTEQFKTTVSHETPSYAVRATAIANMINNQFLVEETDRSAVDMLILVIIGGICAFVLPRVALMHRLLILGGALVVLVNANYFLVASTQALHNTVYLALQLVLFMIAAPLIDSELLSGEASAQTPKPEKLDRKPEIKSKEKRLEELAKAPVREIKSADDSAQLQTAVLKTGEVQATVEDYSAIKLDQRSEPTPPEESESIDAVDQVSGTGDNYDKTPAGLADSDSDDGMSDSDEISVPESRDLPADSDEVQERTPALTESDRMQLEKGTPTISNLGRYQVTGVLGKGAMGLVYKGVDPAINRPVALKTIRLDFVNDPEEMAELKERLHREAQAAGKLSHPNIVTIYDVGSEGPLQYIAMECLEGVTLEDLIRKKTKFNYRIIAQIILQICSALEYAHEQGIVHRDIKPANIMVLSDYRVKVMDYGIARVDSSSMTKTGIAMGTPNYISPEQLKGLSTDRRADLFSLGVVIYEMLLGRRPFKGENITSLIYAIMNNEPQKPSEINPQIPLLFDHILGKALKKDPVARYQKASELAIDLKDFVESFAAH